MFANAIYATDEGGALHDDPRCLHGVSRRDLKDYLRAMAGRGGGPPGGGHRHGHHRGPRDFGPGGRGGFEGFPFGGFGGPGGRFGRGRKARRGDIRTAALLLLAEEPRNGYQIMQEVEERSDGVWRPSPGSVYPALQQLEDEGLICSSVGGGGTGKVFELTDAGRAHVQQRDADAPAPWEQMSGNVSDQAHELAGTMREVVAALTQVIRTGSDPQIAEARKLLTAVRRDLYRILADGDPETPAED
jgi:DNA-binding PadR family transcriptional regulator